MKRTAAHLQRFPGHLLCFCIACLLCVSATYTVWKLWSTRGLLIGLLLYAAAAFLVVHALIVTQKYFLTSPIYCNTIIAVWRGAAAANVLERNKQVAAMSTLAEGSSVRPIERMTGTENGGRSRRRVTLLHVHPLTSAAAAVRAAIVREFRSLESAEES